MHKNPADPYLRIAELITKSLQEELTPAESEELNAWIAESEANKKTWRRLTDPAYLTQRLDYWKDGDTERDWQHLKAKIRPKSFQLRRIAHLSLKYAAVVGALALLYAAGAYFAGREEESGVPDAIVATEKAATPIIPGSNTAQLILSNGEIVSLGSGADRSITETDGSVLENRSDLLSYSAAEKGPVSQTVYNTLVTPRGGEYRVRLPDGTFVWLNAASTLRYPTRYTQHERRVYLTGEAYFEVTKDAERPFVVSSGKADIRVLGTKFNVSAYPDDQTTQTTLAEGSVQIELPGTGERKETGVILKPGYQAVIEGGADEINVQKADLDMVLSWKTNMLIFNGEPLSAILRKLSRYYDVDVVYDAELDTEFHFTGRIEKYEDISAILQLLELTKKVRFTVKGRTLHVQPY